jgi:hypothetical protein
VARGFAFTLEILLLPFSAQLRFHAVEAYDIPHSRDVLLGKGDYEGRLRIRSK